MKSPKVMIMPLRHFVLGDSPSATDSVRKSNPIKAYVPCYLTSLLVHTPYINFTTALAQLDFPVDSNTRIVSKDSLESWWCQDLSDPTFTALFLIGCWFTWNHLGNFELSYALMSLDIWEYTTAVLCLNCSKSHALEFLYHKTRQAAVRCNWANSSVSALALTDYSQRPGPCPCTPSPPYRIPRRLYHPSRRAE